MTERRIQRERNRAIIEQWQAIDEERSWQVAL